MLGRAYLFGSHHFLGMLFSCNRSLVLLLLPKKNCWDTLMEYAAHVLWWGWALLKTVHFNGNGILFYIQLIEISTAKSLLPLVDSSNFLCFAQQINQALC
jgi:hypothetical protein